MTKLRASVLAFVLACGLPVWAAAQAPPRVDFRRDVQPILREHCYTCHGPEQQMNGFRLDRRADAMRGGSQSVIGPGNADGSGMYRRLTGTSAGARMPPSGPLPPEQVADVKAWIDQGAEWPDDVAGIVVTPPVDPAAERLAALIRDGKLTAADVLLRTTPQAARARATGGSTPLMFAALYGDADLMKRLIALGADPRAANVAGATALMWALPDTPKMRVLLAADVNVDARSDDRRTALVIASGIVGAEPAVRLLLEYGADPSPPARTDPQPLREAARVASAGTFRLLLDYGADPTPIAPAMLRRNCFACAQMTGVGGAGPLPITAPSDGGLRPLLAPTTPASAVGVTDATPAAIRAAVDRSLPLLQSIGQPFIRKTGCVSCHHNSLVTSAVVVARRHGYRVDEQAVSAERTQIADYLESWRERTLQNAAIAGAQDTVNYLLVGLAAAEHPADRATDAQAIWLLRRQLADGRWPVATLRPPIESNDIEVTAMAMRAVQLYLPAAARADGAKAIARARDWLIAARGQTTEERAFRLLGLAWADAGRELLASASRDLLAGQRADGGWSQEPDMESDAYATGQALAAVRESGVVAVSQEPALRRGVEFLLRTQLVDGSWLVRSRAVPIQAYFESGFPHGGDQWISAAGTAWAVRALAWNK